MRERAARSSACSPVHGDRRRPPRLLNLPTPNANPVPSARHRIGRAKPPVPARGRGAGASRVSRSDRQLALRRPATGMGGIERGDVGAEMHNNPLDDRRILDAGDDAQPPAAAPAALNVDREHALETLRPRQRPLPLGG